MLQEDDNLSLSSADKHQSFKRDELKRKREDFKRDQRSVSPVQRDPRHREDREERAERAGERRGERPQAEPSKELGVFNIDKRLRESDLEYEFKRFGHVEKVVIVYDRETRRSRGFAFITMESINEATRAKAEMDGTELDGKTIRVDYSYPRPERRPPPPSRRYSRSPPRRRYSRSPPRRREY